MGLTCEIAHAKFVRAGILLEFTDDFREYLIRADGRAAHNARSGILDVSHHRFVLFAKPILKSRVQKLVACAVPAEAENKLADAFECFAHIIQAPKTLGAFSHTVESPCNSDLPCMPGIVGMEPL
jgi:hypothetical protein